MNMQEMQAGCVSRASQYMQLRASAMRARDSDDTDANKKLYSHNACALAACLLTADVNTTHAHVYA